MHIYADMANAVANSTIRFFVDSSTDSEASITGGGQFLLGDTTARATDGGNTPRLQVSSSTSGIWGRGSFTSYTSGDAYAGGVILAKSRSGTVGNHTVVQDGDQLGVIWFEGSDGTDFERGAAIVAEVDGTPGNNDMPGALSFQTTPDGSVTLAERMRITSDGKISIGNESAPLAKLHVKEGDSGVTALTTSADTLMLEAAGNAGMTIATPNTNTGYVAFGDPEDNNVGMVVYRHGGSYPNTFGFFTSGSEHMRLGASGRLKLTNNDEDIDMSSDADGQLTIDGNGYIAGIALNSDAMQIYHNSASRDIVFGTNEAERVRIKSTGHMGINNNSPDQELDIKAISSDATIRLTAANDGDATIEMYSDDADDNIDKWRINSDATGGLRFQSYGTGSWSSALILQGNASANQSVAQFDSGTVSSPAISFIDDEDSGFYRYANNDIRLAIGGAFTAKFGDGFRVLSTAASIYNDNSTAATGFQVDGNSGYTAMARYNGTPCFVNRMSGDGNLISFYESGDNVGAISVSGNTVTYGAFLGNHKGRLSDGSKPTILPGTILETISQSIEWKTATISNVGSASSTVVIPYYGAKTSGTDTVSYGGASYTGTVGYSTHYQPKGDNKHVCIKVSDTASSKAVTGVFVDWDVNAIDAKDNDLDEPYNDLKVGAVGNYFIRMKSGETIAIGDLVESNGDGTGKVQSDDIIRSKTVGKITSTNVIKTYDDGSFLVTAVLYSG